MAPQNVLHGTSGPAPDRLEVGDGPTSAHDGEPLTAMLDGVEQVSKVAGGVGRTHFGHDIRLSDHPITHDLQVTRP
jgi:hypothetical protein